MAKKIAQENQEKEKSIITDKSSDKRAQTQMLMKSKKEYKEIENKLEKWDEEHQLEISSYEAKIKETQGLLEEKFKEAYAIRTQLEKDIIIQSEKIEKLKEENLIEDKLDTKEIDNSSDVDKLKPEIESK